MKTLKVIPGRGLNGKDIKRRLKNKTLQGELFGSESYLVDKEMLAHTKLNKVQQVLAAREGERKIAEMEEKLQRKNDEKNRKQEEERINRLAEAKMKENLKKQTNDTTGNN